MNPTTSPSHNPHRTLALFADPGAQALWAGLLTLDPALQHEFLWCLRDRLAVPSLAGGTHKVRIERLVASTREAEEMLAAEAVANRTFEPTNPPRLTENAYEALRKQHRELGWPAASNLRGWVKGGWNDVLRRAMLATVPDGDAMLIFTSAYFTWEEVASAIVEFRDELLANGHPFPGAFTLHDFYNWAKLPHVLARPGRRPQSQSAFDKFGGYLAAKESALAGDGPPQGKGPKLAVRGGTLSPISGYGYTDDDLKAAVREVVEFRDGSVPRAPEYVRDRQTLMATRRAEGLPERAFASYNKLLRRWKPWDAVLVMCGYPPFGDADLDPERGYLQASSRGNTISDTVLLAGLLEAFEQRGKPFSCGVYAEYIASAQGLARRQAHGGVRDHLSPLPRSRGQARTV